MSQETRKNPPRGAKQASGPLALTQAAKNQTGTVAQQNPKPMSEKDQRAIAADYNAIGPGSFVFQGEYLTISVLTDRMLGRHQKAGWTPEKVIPWFNSLCANLSKASDDIALVAYQIEEFGKSTRFQTTGDIFKNTQSGFKEIKAQATQGRNSFSRLVKTREKIIAFFGEKWTAVYWDPWLTAGMGDEFNKHLATAKVREIGPFALTQYIHSAWAFRLQKAISDAGPGRGGNPRARLITIDVRLGCEAIYFPEDYEDKRLDDNLPPSSRLIKRYNEFFQKNAKAWNMPDNSRILLDRYSFMHINQISEATLRPAAGTTVKPFMPDPPSSGEVFEILEAQVKVVKEKALKTVGPPKTPQSKKPLKLKGQPEPPTPRTQKITDDMDAMEIRNAQKRSASVLSSQSQGRYDPTTRTGTRFNPVDLEAYHRPMNISSMLDQSPRTPSPKIAQDIDALRNADPWKIELPPTATPNSPSTYYRLDMLGRRFKEFLLPKNATAVEKDICAYLSSVVCNPSPEIKIDMNLIKDLSRFKGIPQNTINQALTRVFTHTIAINEADNDKKSWPEDWREAFRRAGLYVAGLRLAELATRPHWIQAIAQICADVISMASPSNNKATPIEVLKTAQGTFYLCALHFDMEELVYDPNQESGWLSGELLFAALRALCEQSKSKFDLHSKQAVINGEEIGNWLYDRDLMLSNEPPRYPQEDGNGHYLPLDQQRYTKLPSVPILTREVYIPVNLSNRHWVLAIVDIKDREIYVFDSLNGEISWADAIREWCTSSWPGTTGFKVQRMDVPHQQNGADCGFWVLRHAKQWLQQNTYEVNQISTANLRVPVATDLGNLYRNGWNKNTPAAKPRDSPVPASTTRKPSQPTSPSPLGPGGRQGSPTPAGNQSPARGDRQRTPSGSRVDQLKGQQAGSPTPTQKDRRRRLTEVDAMADPPQHSPSPPGFTPPGSWTNPLESIAEELGRGPGKSVTSSPLSDAPPSPRNSPIRSSTPPLNTPVLIGPDTWVRWAKSVKGDIRQEPMSERIAKKWFTEKGKKVPTDLMTWE